MRFIEWLCFRWPWGNISRSVGSNLLSTDNRCLVIILGRQCGGRFCVKQRRVIHRR